MCNNCDNEEVVEQELCQPCLDNLSECEECGEKILDEQSSFTVCGNEYCESCHNNLPYCHHCEETVLEVNEHNICDGCDYDYCNCEYCNSYVLTDSTLYDSNDDYVCESCQENGCIPYDSSAWYHFDDLTYHDGEYYVTPPSSGICSYHSCEKEKISGSNSGNYVGFELEIIPKIDRDELAEKVLELENLHCEEDGSLDDDGFEIISNYGDLDVVLKLAERVCNTVSGKAISHDTSCCGLHVHLSKYTNFTTAKMICFWNDPDNDDFIMEFARRSGSTYAEKDSSKCISNFNDKDYGWYYDFEDKYNIVNVTHRTVEVRAFRGTTKKERLLACIELSYFTHEYCKECDKIKDLTWKKFMEWLPEKSVWIKPYLESRKFNMKGEEVCA